MHDYDIVAVLTEAKSGYIHYTLRDKLTFARQLIRDHMADMIIVFDLRRFSRNFVHSAMIFEEIESNSGEIVSVSENIDNSLTGKLIRSILAWSAESERENGDQPLHCVLMSIARIESGMKTSIIRMQKTSIGNSVRNRLKRSNFRCMK